MQARRLLVFVCLVTMLVPAGARSEEEESNWRFNLAPLYLWALSINGDMVVRGRTASVSIDFGNVYDNLQGAFTLRFNGIYKKKIGFIFDYTYLDLGKERVGNLVNIDVGFDAQIANLAGTYRFIDGAQVLDGVAGIRYYNMNGGLYLNNLQVSFNGDQDWVDPIVGLRYGYDFNDQWKLRLYGDIGGFGVSSDFTWQGLATIEYQPWKNVAIIAGYRAIGTNYETGSGNDKFVYDATVYGPLLGIDIRW